MTQASVTLTVFFEESFWVGVFEYIEERNLSVAKITFGEEPKDYEVQSFVLQHYSRLQFSPSVKTVVKTKKK